MIVTDLDRLHALYRPDPVPAATVKEVDRTTPGYAALIAASPFVALAGEVGGADHDAE